MSNEPDEVNSGALATMIVLVFVATFAVALVVTALVRDETNSLHARGDASQERAFRQLRAEQKLLLNSAPAWVDRGAGVTSVPIEDAMKSVAEAIRSNPYALTPGAKSEEEKKAEAEAEAKLKEDAESDDAEDSATGDLAKKTLAPVAPAPAAPAPVAPAPVAPAHGSLGSQ